MSRGVGGGAFSSAINSPFSSVAIFSVPPQAATVKKTAKVIIMVGKTFFFLRVTKKCMI